jgi:hypothetical protein
MPWQLTILASFVRAPFKAPFVAPDSSDQEIKICHNSSALLGQCRGGYQEEEKKKKKRGQEEHGIA